MSNANSMRVSQGGLLVLLAFTVPFLVELRTVLVFFGIELSVVSVVAIGVVMIAAITFWATLPEQKQSGTAA